VIDSELASHQKLEDRLQDADSAAKLALGREAHLSPVTVLLEGPVPSMG
jgi:hypothetical protein